MTQLSAPLSPFLDPLIGDMASPGLDPNRVAVAGDGSYQPRTSVGPEHPRGPRHTLRWRFVALVAALLGLFALCGIMLTWFAQEAHRDAKVKDRAESFGALYERPLVLAIGSGERRATERAAAVLVSVDDAVSSPLVLLADGRALAGRVADHPGVVSRVRTGWPLPEAVDNQTSVAPDREGIAQVVHPISEDGRVLGVLVFDLNAEVVGSQDDLLNPGGMLFVIFFVAAGTAVAFAAISPTTRRLQKLVDHAQDSAHRVLPDLIEGTVSGRFDPDRIHLSSMDVGGSDEVGVLSDAMAAHTHAVEELAKAFLGRIAGADARFSAGFKRSPSAIIIVNGAGYIVEANSAYAQMIGVVDPNVMVGQRWLGHIHEDDQAACEQALTQDASPEPMETRYLRINGEVAYVLQTWVAVNGVGGETLSFIQAQDVSGHRQATENLQRLAFTDPLTGLPNRAALEGRLHEAAAGADATHQVGMAMLDLDRFKLINDSLGHQEGDKVLKAIGKRLRTTIPDGAMVARTGGDEFAVVVTGLPDAELMALLAERLIATMEAPVLIGGRRFYVSASVGIATADRPELVDALSGQSDAASYVAKSRGRKRWLRFDETMAQEATERLALENDLREALGDRQLELHYQPIVASDDRQLTGLEALVRWRHPERGLLTPDIFIELAEDTGLISILGYEVLDLALSDIVRLDGIAGIDDTWRMSVNVSPAQMRQPDFVATVARQLRTHDVPAERLMLEITESMLVDDGIIERLQDLRRMGIWVALDDFGTGYTGVAYLSRIGVDVLKIDRSIVQLASDERGLAVLRAIGQLGHALGMKVVAEGIETEEEARIALECSCDRLQGFHISRPVPITDIALRVLPAMAASPG